MIRSASILRLAAAFAVCGSFLAVPPVPAFADEASGDAAGASGSTLAVSPLRVEMTRESSGATVYLTNSSDRQLAVQSRIFSWSQNAGNDVYAPSGDLTVSPSISMIPPGETQIVRLLRKGAASPGEKRFRLAVDQLPDPALTQAGQTQVRIRFTLPVFVDRDTAAPAALDWRVSGDRLEVANSGGATARVGDLKVKTAGGTDIPVERNTMRYVQGSSTISWPIGKGCSAGPVRITAVVDGRTVDAQTSTTCS